MKKKYRDPVFPPAGYTLEQAQADIDRDRAELERVKAAFDSPWHEGDSGRIEIDLGIEDIRLLRILDMGSLIICQLGPASGYFKDDEHYKACFWMESQRWSWTRVGTRKDGFWCLPEDKKAVLRKLESILAERGIKTRRAK